MLTLQYDCGMNQEEEGEQPIKDMHCHWLVWLVVDRQVRARTRTILLIRRRGPGIWTPEVGESCSAFGAARGERKYR